jgi:3-deoxy-manno-octulosonate cytidylyltransferase (CMP-KDO synthetase)
LGGSPFKLLSQEYPELPAAFPFQRHIGVYLYRCDLLRKFVSWAPGLLETAEQLEQLRILENGHRICVVRVSRASLSIDTAEDYEQACRYFEQLTSPNDGPAS